MTEMIAVKEISKSFGDVRAVRGISFSVEKGEIFGFLGPNGAGKTTTISMLSGLLKPDSGSITIDGMDMAASGREIRGSWASSPRRSLSTRNSPGGTTCSSGAGCMDSQGSDLKGRVDRALELVDLSDRAKDAVKTDPRRYEKKDKSLRGARSRSEDNSAR